MNMFRNSNSNLQYNKPLNKGCVQTEKTSALLRGLRKEYEALHNGKFEITPVYAKLIYLRKVQQDYTFWINPSIKPIRGRIENKSDEKVSKWKFAVSLGNFYSKQNGQKPLFAVFAQTPEGSLRNTTRERLKKAIELGNYYSKQNGKSLSVSCNHPTTLSGPFYNKCHYRKTTPITNKPPLFESAVVGKRNFLENYVSLQNEKLTVDHVIVGLNEQNRTTPNWLCKKYCCISKEIEACKEQFNAENYAVWGKVDSNLLNDITNILDDDCISTPEPSPSSSLESFYEFPESETTDATTLKTIYGGWGDQNTDNETKTKQDVKDVEVVVHEAIMPSSPMICSVKAIRSLIKDSIHNFIEDLQNMDVKYKWQFQEDYFISKSSESMKNEPGTIFPSPELKISKSDKFFCLNDVFIRLVAERNFEKYEDTDSEEECGREIEVLKSGLIYLHSDQYSDCENI